MWMSISPERAEAEQAQRFRKRLWQLGGLVILTLGASLLMGRYPGPYFTDPRVLLENELARGVLLNLRLPRILAAVLLGMTLSAAGATFQAIFRNPLVDSGFLGVSQGAAFGASLAIVFLGGAAPVVQASAAFFAFLGLAASYFLARKLPLGDWVLRLVMAGIGISALYASGTGVVKYLADPLKQLPDITFWLLGGLWATTWSDVLQVLPVVIPALVILILMRWRLNLLSMRDETAFSLGAALGRERMVMLVAAVAATAAMVSKAGQIGWVGLIVPHIARRLVGADAQRALPGAILIGSLFVLLCDDTARTVLSGEIPLGILTSAIGAFFFFTILLRKQMAVRT
jgi:iron complex transport system permease protein